MHFCWCVGSWGRKSNGGEGVDGWLSLSTLLMNHTLDCQKLRGCLNEQFFVDDTLTTKIMSQNHLKKEPQEIWSRCHDYQNVRTRCHLKRATLGEIYFMSMHHLWTFWVNLGCNIDNLRLLEPISGHKTRVTKTVSLYSYLRFCGNIMCITGPNMNLRLTKATRMDINGCGMPNDSSRSLFGQWGVLWVHMGAKWRIGDFVIMVILEIKTTIFTCLPGTEGCDSFPKRLDLVLAPNKTNEGVKKQWNTRYHV